MVIRTADLRGSGWFARLRHAALVAMVNVIVLATLLALAEGASGLVLFAYRLYARPWATAEAYHAKNDPELGWVNIPGYFNPNMYGPGQSLRINQQGFRGAEEYTPDPPAG